MRSILYSLLLLLVFAGTCMAEEILLVTQANNPVNSLTRQEVRNIFLGKKTTWSDGQNIVVFIQQDNTATNLFSREYLAKSPQQFYTYWKKALFTGTGNPPITLSNDSEMKAFISAKRSSIGYIGAEALDGSVKELKIIDRN